MMCGTVSCSWEDAQVRGQPSWMEFQHHRFTCKEGLVNKKMHRLEAPGWSFGFMQMQGSARFTCKEGLINNKKLCDRVREIHNNVISDKYTMQDPR